MRRAGDKPVSGRGDSGQRFDYDEFLERVAEREGVDRADAAYHAQVVVAQVAEIVPGAEMEQVGDQLTVGFDDLLELVDEDVVQRS